MKISVWDTYVTKKDGAIMHFDILVPDTVKNQEEVYRFGRDYLRTKGLEGQNLAAGECQFCHIEEATEEMNASIEQQGYHIIEMEGCN